MSDFTTDTPGSNGPAPLGSEPQNGSATTAPRFAPRPGDTGPADLAGPSTQPRPQPAPQAPGQHAARPAGPPQPNVKGRIHIEDEVVEKVAALAAREVNGVADLGGDLARAVESVRERIGIGNKRTDQGVKADVEGNEVFVSVTIMVEFGHVVLDVARRVQHNVAAKTQRMLGLKVVEVNVTVDDVCTVRRDEEGTEVVVTGG
jgi:uncharacterized alkaline shock family protein YloU